MNIRRATAEDLAAIMQRVLQAVPQMRAAGNLQWDSTYPSAEIFAQDIARSQLWLAEIDSIIAGIAAITTEQSPEYVNVGWDITEPAIVIHRLLVDAIYRGQGIAAALMHHAVTVASDSGISILRVDTNKQNESAQKLFTKLGYVFSGETDLAFRPGLRIVCYEKRLRAS